MGYEVPESNKACRVCCSGWFAGFVTDRHNRSDDRMGEVVRTVYSEAGRHRARIVRVSETAFRVDIDRQYDDIDAGGFNHGKFWSPLGDWWSYADTVERALEIAAENLRTSDAAG